MRGTRCGLKRSALTDCFPTTHDGPVFAIEGSELLDGALPRRQARLVQAWIELRRDELMADWSLAVKGHPVFPIDPLK